MLLLTTHIPIILSLFSISCLVNANTEIVNFAVSQTEYQELTFPWTQVNYHNREISFNITPILHKSQASLETGIWLALDLDDHDWDSYNKFTLRASWSTVVGVFHSHFSGIIVTDSWNQYPCDIYLNVLDPHEVASQFSQTPSGPLHQTRKKYAHVYAVNFGVPVPSPSGEDMTWLRLRPVPITLILEPLHFGVLPHSVVPVIFTLMVAIGALLVIMPHVVRYFDSIVAPIREDILRSKQE